MAGPNNEDKSPWAAVVLSAGNSSRMHQHKALLQFDLQNTFIQKIVREYISAGCSHIVIVVNESNMELISRQFEHSVGLKPILVLNKHPEYERFYSVQLGLQACDTYENCFIQPCDNPFVTADLINGMLDFQAEGCYTTPVFKEKKGHPILLSRHIMNEICAAKEHDGNLKYFLRKYSCRDFETGDQGILTNINDLNDYQHIFKD
jgi:molybdenum cofactor cytidylyltransferase